jgi:hypothetical protein
MHAATPPQRELWPSIGWLGAGAPCPWRPPNAKPGSALAIRWLPSSRILCTSASQSRPPPSQRQSAPDHAISTMLPPSHRLSFAVSAMRGCHAPVLLSSCRGSRPGYSTKHPGAYEQTFGQHHWSTFSANLKLTALWRYTIRRIQDSEYRGCCIGSVGPHTTDE